MSELLSPEIEQETTLLISVIAFKGDRVLLLKKVDQSEEEKIKYIYDLPTGKFNTVETPVSIAQKILKEETGLHTEKDALQHDPDKIYISEREKKEGVIKKTAVQTFVTIKTTGEIGEKYDTIPEWILYNNLDQIALVNNTKQAVLDAQQLVRKNFKYDHIRNTNQ